MYFTPCDMSSPLYKLLPGRYTGGMIIDVTLTISPELAHWPGDPSVEASSFGGEPVRVSRWTLGSHAGTHVDAQTHFSAGPQTVDQFDPAVLLGPCRVLDFPDAAVITADLLHAHDLTGVERLLLRTRNSRHWMEAPTTFDESFVGLDAGAAQVCLDCGVKLLGVDGLSVEPYHGNGAVHNLLLGAGVILLEGLNLAQVPAGAYQLVCAPLKLRGADGAPARVFLLD